MYWVSLVGQQCGEGKVSNFGDCSKSPVFSSGLRPEEDLSGFFAGNRVNG
jgi:hypothetical protein